MALRLASIKNSNKTSILALLIIFIAIWIPFPAHSADSLNELIFKNCEMATTAFDRLSLDGERDTLEYLVRVLSLNTGAPDVPEAFALPQGGNIGEGSPSALWQAVDARRELSAKKCALQLLDRAGVRAASFLPEITSIYNQESVSDEIAVEMVKVVSHIVESCQQNGQELPTVDLSAIIRQLVGPRPQIAQIILKANFERSLPDIMIYLSMIEDRAADTVIEFLIEADPDLSKTYQALFSIAKMLEPAQVARLLSLLPLPKGETLIALVPQIASFASDLNPEFSVIFLKTLGQTCRDLDGISLPNNLEAAIVAHPFVRPLAPKVLDLDHQRCLAGSIKGLSNSIGDDISSQIKSLLSMHLGSFPTLLGK